jgi:hypothetical protein
VVVLTGRAEVRGDEAVDNVFVADGPAVVDGRVQKWRDRAETATSA